MARTKAPGLEWRQRKTGEVPYWIAPKAAVKAGFMPASVNLAPLIDEPARLIGRCTALSAEAEEFLIYGGVRQQAPFDGTLGNLLHRYETDEESSYKALGHATKKVYSIYLRKLRNAYGERLIDRITGKDLKAWHRVATTNPDAHGKPMTAAGAMMFAILKAAIKYGISDRLHGCPELSAVVNTFIVPKPDPRTQVITRDEVIRLRKAAHAAGAPSRALATALQFDGVIRLWDVIGQWVPLSDARPSAVLGYNKKWIGPRWEDVTADMTITITPTKTFNKTGKSTTILLSLCPMVMEELAHWPQHRRNGPLIVYERKGLPYLPDLYRNLWQKDAMVAGISRDKLARDLRASANTEARTAGAATDDLAKVAAHSPAMNRKVYDRDTVVAFERVAKARADHVKTKQK